MSFPNAITPLPYTPQQMQHLLPTRHEIATMDSSLLHTLCSLEPYEAIPIAPWITTAQFDFYTVSAMNTDNHKKPTPILIHMTDFRFLPRITVDQTNENVFWNLSLSENNDGSDKVFNRVRFIYGGDNLYDIPPLAVVRRTIPSFINPETHSIEQFCIESSTLDYYHIVPYYFLGTIYATIFPRRHPACTNKTMYVDQTMLDQLIVTEYEQRLLV